MEWDSSALRGRLDRFRRQGNGSGREVVASEKNWEKAGRRCTGRGGGRGREQRVSGQAQRTEGLRLGRRGREKRGHGTRAARRGPGMTRERVRGWRERKVCGGVAKELTGGARVGEKRRREGIRERSLGDARFLSGAWVSVFTQEEFVVFSMGSVFFVYFFNKIIGY